MNDLVERIARKVEYNGAAYIRIPGIGLFTELIIFEMCMPSVDMPRVDVNIE